MWRRLADVILRRPAAPDDERSIQAKQLAALEQDMIATNDDLRRVAKGARDRLASYRRIRLGR